MQKLDGIQNFLRLEEEQNFSFPEAEWHFGQARLVKMRINAPQATNIFITRIDKHDPDTGELFFENGEYTDVRLLASVPAGLTPIQFYYKGSFALTAVGGAIWLDTLEGGQAHIEPTDPTSYARVWEREEEDPRILEIKRQARINQELLLRQMAADRAERQSLFDAMQELKESRNVTTPSNAGTTPDQGTTAGVAPVGGPSDTTAPASTPAGTGGESNAGA